MEISGESWLHSTGAWEMDLDWRYRLGITITDIAQLKLWR